MQGVLTVWMDCLRRELGVLRYRNKGGYVKRNEDRLTASFLACYLAEMTDDRQAPP